MSDRRGMRARFLLPAVVFVILAAVSIAGFGVTTRLVGEQETRLLEQRADEVAALLASSINRIEAPLHVLAAIAAAEDADLGAFVDGAAAEVPQDGVIALFATRVGDDGVEVLAPAGSAPAAGTVLDAAHAELAQHAMAVDGMVGALIDDGKGALLTYAVADGTTVVFREAPINPRQPVPAAPGTPFEQLRLALYVGEARDADQIMLTTETELPIPGEVVERPMPVGAEAWRLVVGADGPLIGSFAVTVPWLLLGVGLVAALLAAAAVLMQTRRRDYALALVTRRTVELRAAQHAAEQANRSKSQFLSRMSHELRTPLNAVLGFGQILEFGDLTDDQREAVGHILKGGKHLLGLIDEVLDISRIETGDIALSPEAIRVGDLIDDAVSLIRPLAEQRGIRLSTNCVTSDAYVFADRQRTKQVLLNLLSNAVKYNRQRGSVTVSCGAADNGALFRIVVEDTGPGMTADQLDRLFTPFDRLGAERTDIEGTGIGLTLARNLAQAMSGNLGVESVPGHGSTFWLDVPQVEGPVDRYERLAGPRAAGPGQDTEPATLTVLHIEDNLANLKLVERIADNRPGITVIGAMQGQLGLELASQHRPRLVLLDLHLPDMTGDEVLQKLRDDPATADIPVAIISADATPGHIQRLLSAGAAAYLTKPIDVRELLRILDESLAEMGPSRSAPA